MPARFAAAAALAIASWTISSRATASSNDVISYQFGLISGFAVEAAELMPEPGYPFRPVETVRTFAQLVGHLADASYATCALAAGRRNPNTRSFEALTSKASLVEALQAARSFCLSVYAKRPAGELAAMLPGTFPFAPAGASMSGDDIVHFTTAHTYEHYGNMSTYLRMKGIEPPSTTATRAALAGRRGRTPAPSQPAPGLRLAAVDPYLMERDTEIALARSAGPPEVAAGAAVLVLKRDGTYETAVRGANTFVCFLGRAWTGPAPVKNGRRVLGQAHLDPAVTAPQCFNALAVPSVLEWHKLTTRMLFDDRTTEEVEDAVQEALHSGRLLLPAPGAMSYMVSAKQHLGEKVGRFRPHLMFYTPYAVNTERFGTRGLSMHWPFVTDEGGPWAVSTVPIAHFSDGSS